MLVETYDREGVVMEKKTYGEVNEVFGLYLWWRGCGGSVG